MNADDLDSGCTTHFWTLGTSLAVVISWSVNKSVLWAMLHGLFSWLYVTYYALRSHPLG